MSQAHVSLHPLASRQGIQSATIIPVTTSDYHESTVDTHDYIHEPSASSQVYGLQHDDLEEYPIIHDLSQPTAQDVDISNAYPGLLSPIRAMSVAQLDQLHSKYVALDVPHNVVFPYLHGVDGSVPAQNLFFKAPMSGQPVPHYRGLTILRADMPSAEEWERSQAAQRSPRARAGTFSSIATQSSSSPSDSEEGHADATWQQTSRAVPIYNADHSMTELGTSAQISPSTSSPSSRPSMFSLASERYSAGSRSSVSTISDVVDDSSKLAATSVSPRQISPIVSEPQPRHSIINSTVFPNEILRPPTVSRKPYGRKGYPCNPVMLGDDEDDDSEMMRIGPVFHNPAQAPGISLRNFKTQCAKYATISDIVIYCPAGYHTGALTLAKWVCEAQAALRKERLQRGWGGLQYNVFILTDSFDAVEIRYTHLVSIDSRGFNRNCIDFVEREREEMERLTRASEIDDNVWLGCSADAPGACSAQAWNDAGPPTPEDNTNPQSFAICIQNVEAVDPPTSASLRNASHYLDLLESSSRFEQHNRSKAFTLGQEDMFDMDASRPHLRDLDSRCESRNGMLVLGPNGWTPKSHHSSMRSDLSAARIVQARDTNRRMLIDEHDFSDKCGALQLDASSVLHLEFPATGDRNKRSEWIEMIANRILELCTWIKQQSCPPVTSLNKTFQDHGRSRSNGNQRPLQQAPQPRRVLLHCADGYTETSVLALSYLMFSRELSLPEAYLDLQLRAQRSFFVYASDMPVLERVDAMLKRSRSAHTPPSPDTRRYLHSPSKSHGTISFADEQHSNLTNMSLRMAAARAGGICRTSTPTPRSAQLASQAVRVRDQSWFDKKRFDGAFPSRILPFLYLGNLIHASNVDMLRVLGITHLVSVGETALQPPDTSSSDGGHDDSRAVPSLTYESQGITVLNVRNVSDDGIDSLRGTMREAVQFIESVRLSGGQVLVHCRVGVSRSTTIVLAYIMAYLDLGLVESYLLVRSRRLNIVIQPHLLFLWELRGWECLLHKIKQHRANTLRASLAGQRPESLREAFSRMSAHSFHGHSGRSDQGSDSYQSACSSPSGSPLITAMSVDSDPQIPWLESEDLSLEVEIGAGAGSIHGFKVYNTALLPFGAGSPAGLPYQATRLTWGYLARGIADLNSRYFD